MLQYISKVQNGTAEFLYYFISAYSNYKNTKYYVYRVEKYHVTTLKENFLYRVLLHSHIPAFWVMILLYFRLVEIASVLFFLWLMYKAL